MRVALLQWIWLPSRRLLPQSVAQSLGSGAIERSAASNAGTISAEALRRAFGVYLGALYPAVAELRELPPVRQPSPLVALMNRLEPRDVAWAKQREREFRRYGDRHRQNASALAAAVADLQVQAKPDLLRVAFDRANDYIERLGEQRTPELRAEWTSVHAHLMREAHAIDNWVPPEARSSFRRMNSWHATVR
jgi:hypothetical protein